MANEDALRDGNHVPVLLAITNDSNQETRMVRVDPSTNRILADVTGSSIITGSGTANQIAYFTGTQTIGSFSNSTAGFLLTSNGAGSPPSFQAPPGTGLTVGTTTISSGTTTRILYDNAGVLGEYTLTGTGTVVAMQTAPSFLTSITTPSVLASSNDSGALGASGTAFADLFLASGGVINWNAGAYSMTQAATVMTLSGTSNNCSIVINHDQDTAAFTLNATSSLLTTVVIGQDQGGYIQMGKGNVTKFVKLAGYGTTAGVLTIGDSSMTQANKATYAGLKRNGTGLEVRDGNDATPSFILSAAFIAAQATTPYTVLPADTSKVFTNEGASAKIVFNLPTAVAGYRYTFVVQDADGIDITANTGDTIRFAGTVTAAAGTITSTTIGSTITLVAINATEWIATSLMGTWA